MSLRYHINPVKGPLKCSAEAGKCPYGANAPHFDSKGEAQVAFEKQLSHENGHFSSINRKPKAAPRTLEVRLQKLDERLEESEFDDVMAFANSSKANHELLNKLIEKRVRETVEYNNSLEKINPNSNPDSGLMKKTFNELKREYQRYRNQTAMLVEAHTNSSFYVAATKELEDPTHVGNAQLATSIDHSDKAWVMSRFNTIGGSDVGAIVLQDFENPEKLSSFDKLYIGKVETSKIVPPTINDAEKSIAMSETSRRGALYRGTVWEDRIRDDYAKDHPEMTVYRTKDQFTAPDRPWQKVNFDGVVSDRADGAPNGILEIKTGGEPEKWANGVPITYRAQVLYYLNATGFEYADVRVLLNDGEPKDFRLNATDDVYPGCGIDMNTYIENRVTPWFEGLKAQREE